MKTPMQHSSRATTPRASWVAAAITLLTVACSVRTPPYAPAPPIADTDTSPPPLAVGVSDIEFIGPLAGWRNVKADYGAVGDGIADDTAALQRGLDALYRYDSASGTAVLFLPAGTYRITRGLQMRLNDGASIIGADPANTVIAWDGPAKSAMLLTSGTFDTLFTRLTWDGRGRAQIGVAQWWNFRTERANYQGTIKHIDEEFRNLDIGISGGRLGADYGQGDSETLIERVHFRNLHIAGVNVGSFNALNWWIWDSLFTDCERGVSNVWTMDDAGATTGAGTFSVYRSRFERSRVADAVIGNTGWFSFYGNYSENSRRFIEALPNGANSGPILAQNNTVIDTLDDASISIGNEGPLILLDNRIRSREGAHGAVVRFEALGGIGGRDVLSLGNQFTVANAMAHVGTAGRILARDSTIPRSMIRKVLGTPLEVARNFHRKVFEVAVGASSVQIQATINAAATVSDNAIVHLPAGNYHLDRSLVIPANTRMQLAGDSGATKLWWTGHTPTETMIVLEGPSHATLRDLCLVGARTTAIDLRNADQPGGRIFVEGSRLAAFQVTGLRHTRLDAQANSGIAGLAVSDSASVLAIAGFGPIRMAGDSNVFVSDSWYEGDESELVRADSGNFTYLGGQMAPYSNGVRTGRAPDAPAVSLDNYHGRMSIIGATMNLRRSSNGLAAAKASGDAYALFFGVAATEPGYFHEPTGINLVGLVFAKLYSPETGARNIPDVGHNSLAFVTEGMEMARSVVWEAKPYTHVPNVTDVRLFRVFDADTGIGLRARP